MRPLRLRLNGLRSYFTEQEIDFSKAGLVAIVGDTGAGKSSLLEAICFALYGAATWSARDAKDLISDRADTVRVQFDFLADSRRWQVTRATSTGSYPPPIHELLCLDDPKLRFDGANEVTKQIEKLIGLSYQAFLRAVVLPQGRFQELLQASPSDRTKILKGIFRLDLLDSMRDITDRMHRENRDRIQQLDLERAGMLPDPPETLRRRGEEAERARELIERLETSHREVETRLQQAARWETAAVQLQAATAQLREPLSAHPANRLREIVENATPLLEQIRALEELRATVVREEAALSARITRLEEAGLGARGLAICEQKLTELRRSIEESIRSENSMAAREAEIDTLAAALSEGSEELRRREEVLQNATDQLVRIREEQARMLEHSNSARMRLQLLREREDAGRAAEHELQELESQLTQLLQEREGLRKNVHDREATLARARAALEVLQRRHAAAHASRGFSAGDPCPVCERELPSNFRPLKVPAEAKARSLLELEEGHLRASASALAHIEATLLQSDSQRKQQAKRVASARASVHTALVQLQELLPRQDTAADLEAAVAAMSVSAIDLEEAEAQIASKREHRDTIHQSLIRTQALLQSTRLAQSEAREASAKSSDQREEDWAGLLRVLQSAMESGVAGDVIVPPIPKRTKKQTVLGTHAADPVRIRLGLDSVDRAASAIQISRGVLEAFQQQEREIRARLEQIRTEEGTHRRQQDKEVTQPLLALERELIVLHERILQAMRLRESLADPLPKARSKRSSATSATSERALRLPERIPPEQFRDPNELVLWAEELEACGKDLEATLESEARRAGDSAKGSRRDAWERLEIEARAETSATGGRTPDSGVASSEPVPDDELESVIRTRLDTLSHRLQEAIFVSRSAMKEIELARSQLPRWTVLRDALERARPSVDALGELTRLLSDGKFVGHVVRKQQRGLLAIASELLCKTSGGRFGFAESFEVVDLLTGQIRNVKTLSGGETFLASLALALGLVELAGRSGGRLDALFLDEGFGSLDANCLAEALEALGQQAQAGRLVAVISHLHAVAESIDDVLMVTRDRSGSRARWLRGEEREALVLQDAGNGLLV